VNVWRICLQAHVATGLLGTGGLHVSGRWHHRGNPIVYTSATPSLAALEVLAHVDPATAPPNLRLVEILIPDGLSLETCDPSTLAPDWMAFPAPQVLQDFGSTWLASHRSAVLRVPSALLPIERNFILNPLHSDANQFQVVRDIPFSFDVRLL